MCRDGGVYLRCTLFLFRLHLPGICKKLFTLAIATKASRVLRQQLTVDEPAGGFVHVKIAFLQHELDNFIRCPGGFSDSIDNLFWCYKRGGFV